MTVEYEGAAKPPIRLGVNVDHVATLRNARGGAHPDPVRAARLAADAGADGITAHLREDRRHVREDDMRRLRDEVGLPLNFEMAASDEMRRLCLDIRPQACCLVPENRMERTTEGGLDAVGGHNRLAPLARELADAGVRVSFFIDPEPAQAEAARSAGAAVVELHTGAWAGACAATDPDAMAREFEALKTTAAHAAALGLEVHAGHGLDFRNVQAVAGLPEIAELNIGHFLVGEAVFMGLGEAVREMKRLMQDARTGALY